MMPLAGSEHRGNNDRSGMDRATLEGIVEILAMGSRAVDERRARRVEAARMPNCRARSIVVPAGQGGFDVVLAAGGDAEPGDVNHEFNAFRAHSSRQAGGVERVDTVGELLRDRYLRQ